LNTFNGTRGLTIGRAGNGNVMVVDWNNDAIRSVTKEGAVVSTLAGGHEDDEENDDENDDENDEERFADGQGANARFTAPYVQRPRCLSAW